MPQCFGRKILKKIINKKTFEKKSTSKLALAFSGFTSAFFSATFSATAEPEDWGVAADGVIDTLMFIFCILAVREPSTALDSSITGKK